MTRTKKTIAAVVLVVVLLVILGLALASIGRLDPRSVGDTMLAKAGASMGMKLEAEEISFGAIKGLEFGGFRAQGRLEAGRLLLEAERVVFKPQLIPLLAGDVVITQAVLEEPVIRLTRRDQTRGKSLKAQETEKQEGPRRKKARKKKNKPAPRTAAELGAGEATKSRDLALEIQALSIVNADLQLVSPKAEHPSVRFEDLTFELRNLDMDPDAERPILDATASGSFSAATMAIPDLTGRNVSGRLNLAGGVLSLLALKMDHRLGPLRAEQIDVDLASEPFEYTLDLSGGPLDTGQVLGAEPGSDMGASSLRFSGEGSGPEAEGLDGKGSLDVAGGTLPSMKVLSDLDRLLGSADLVGTRHEPTKIDFRIANDRIEIEPCQFEAEGVRLDLEGWADRGGELSLDLVVSAPRGKIEIAELSQTVLDKLTDGAGRTSLAFRIHGTRDDPTVLPDIPELTRSERERLEQELKDALRDKLRELFGKDDDD